LAGLAGWLADLGWAGWPGLLHAVPYLLTYLLGRLVSRLGQFGWAGLGLGQLGWLAGLAGWLGWAGWLAVWLAWAGLAGWPAWAGLGWLAGLG
jgi:hypothetical protein